MLKIKIYPAFYWSNTGIKILILLSIKCVQIHFIALNDYFFLLNAMSLPLYFKDKIAKYPYAKNIRHIFLELVFLFSLIDAIQYSQSSMLFRTEREPHSRYDHRCF